MIKRHEVQLKRSITWMQGAALTIGAVLGSGILVLPAIVAEMAGPASLVSWLLMGIFSLPMVIAIGAMSSRFPDSGGMAAYARQGFGPRISQLTGLLMLSAMPIGMPLTALVGAHYWGSVMSWSMGEIHLAAAGLLVVAIGLNYRGIELSGRIQITVVSIILFILMAVVVSAVPEIRFAAFTPFAPHGWMPVGEAMVLLFFAFMGWEMISHLAEEFQNPVRDIPKSLGLAVIVVNFIYFAVAFVMVGSVAYLKGSSTSAMINLVAQRWGDAAGMVVAALGLIVCYCPVHSFIAGFSRLVYAQAREGYFPQQLGKLHPKYQTPYRALLLFGPIFLLILGLSYWLSWDLKPLFGIPSTTFLLVYMIGMAAAGRVLDTWLAKGCAWLSVVLSGVIFMFAGWFMIFPLVVGLIVLYKIR